MKHIALAAGLVAGVLTVAGPPPTAHAATFTVTNTDPAGPGSLAQAFVDANAAAGPDVIEFDAGVTGTIDIGATTLDSTEGDLEINGPGADVLTVTNTGPNPVLVATAGAFSVDGLAVSDTEGPAISVANTATDLTVAGVEISESDSIGIDHDGTGAVAISDTVVRDSGFGIQILDGTSATLERVTVSDMDFGGVAIQSISGAVSTDVLDVSNAPGSALLVLTTGGDVTLERTTVTDSAANVQIDTATNVTLTDVTLVPALGVMISSVADVKVDGTSNTTGLNVMTVDSVDIDDLTIVPGSIAGGGVDINTVAGPVSLTNVTGTGFGFFTPFAIDTATSVSLENVQLENFVALSVSTVTGDVTFTDVDARSTFVPSTISMIGGAVSVTGGELGGLNVSDVTGSASISDVDLPAATVATISLEVMNVDGVVIDGVDASDFGASISGLPVTADVAITSSTFGSALSAALRIESSVGSSVVVDSTTIVENGVEVSDLLDVTITNSTITGGSGIFALPLQATNAPTTIVNSTISGSLKSPGGFALVADNSAVVLANSIVSGNSGAEFDAVNGGTITADSSVLTPDADTPIGGANNIETDDPMVLPLADNGGPTRTMLPMVGSPVLDAGDAGLAGVPADDQRGVSRPVGPAIDIGSVEFSPSTVSLSDVTVSETDGMATLTITRSGLGDGDLAIDVATADGSATAGDDYEATSTTVTFPSGDTADKTVDVPVFTDSLLEGDETFSVSLSNEQLTSSASLIGTATATVTITDVPPGPAISSLSPARFADSRPGESTVDGRFAGVGKRPAGTQWEVVIAGRGGVPADARGVVMNVTAVAAEGVGFVTAHPCVSPRPTASSLNYTAGVNLGNEVVAGLSGQGTVCLFSSAAAHLTVDVVGFIGADSPTMPVTPARILDTRASGETVDGQAEGGGTTSAGGEIVLDVGGRGGVPANADAAIVNVTAVGATGTGFVTVHPCVSPRPLAASLNFVAGVNRGNELIASLDGTGDICIYTSGAINVTADVVGYVPAGTNLTALSPARLLDTRPGESTVDDQQAGAGQVSAGGQVTLPVAGRGGVPAGAAAVVINVTAIGAEGVGFVTVHPCVDPPPLAASLNYVAGVNGGNEVVAQLDGNGDVCLFTSAGAHLTVDAVAALT